MAWFCLQSASHSLEAGEPEAKERATIPIALAPGPKRGRWEVLWPATAQERVAESMYSPQLTHHVIRPPCKAISNQRSAVSSQRPAASDRWSVGTAGVCVQSARLGSGAGGPVPICPYALSHGLQGGAGGGRARYS